MIRKLYLRCFDSQSRMSCLVWPNCVSICIIVCASDWPHDTFSVGWRQGTMMTALYACLRACDTCIHHPQSRAAWSILFDNISIWVWQMYAPQRWEKVVFYDQTICVCVCVLLMHATHACSYTCSLFMRIWYWMFANITAQRRVCVNTYTHSLKSKTHLHTVRRAKTHEPYNSHTNQTCE